MDPRRLLARCLVCAALAASPLFIAGDASAQQEVSLELRSGVAIPAGSLARGFDIGPAVGMSLNFRRWNRYSLRLNQAVDLYTKPVAAANEQGMPSLFLFRWNIGGIYHLVSDRGGLSVDVGADAGLSALTSERRMVSGKDGDRVWVSLGEVGPSMASSTTISYQVAPTTRAFVQAQGAVAFTSRSATEDFPLIAPGMEPIGTIWAFPIMLGMSLHF